MSAPYALISEVSIIIETFVDADRPGDNFANLGNHVAPQHPFC
jgi:hypothetical protein